MDRRELEPRAVEGLSEHQVNSIPITYGNHPPGRGNPNANWVTLGGLFKLAFRSRKPAAVRFTDWMADEVAPARWLFGHLARLHQLLRDAPCRPAPGDPREI
jgi:prophage antirepressor-like protein